MFLRFFRLSILAFEVGKRDIKRFMIETEVQQNTCKGSLLRVGFWFHFAERSKNPDQIFQAYNPRFKAHTNTPATVRTVAEISG